MYITIQTADYKMHVFFNQNKTWVATIVGKLLAKWQLGNISITKLNGLLDQWINEVIDV